MSALPFAIYHHNISITTQPIPTQQQQQLQQLLTKTINNMKSTTYLIPTFFAFLTIILPTLANDARGPKCTPGTPDRCSREDDYTLSYCTNEGFWQSYIVCSCGKCIDGECVNNPGYNDNPEAGCE